MAEPRAQYALEHLQVSLSYHSFVYITLLSFVLFSFVLFSFFEFLDTALPDILTFRIILTYAPSTTSHFLFSP